MDQMFKKLAEKKGKSAKLSESERDAKMSVIEDLKKMMEGELSGSLKGLKKVTVASPDQEGLEHGLEKAQELISSAKEDKESSPFAGEESPEEESMEHESMESEGEESEEELDAKLAELMAKKKALESKKLKK